MSYSLKLDRFSHDIHIKNGKFVRVNGSDQVRQRILVALWHHFNEYFLNRPAGVPWYNGILGNKISEENLKNILRKKIQRVPGVIQVMTISITRMVRDYTISVTCSVESGSWEPGSNLVTLSGIAIGGE